MRFEKLIEGIQDYEKIRIIREMLANDSSLEAVEYEKLLNDFLDGISLENMDEDSAEQIVKKGREILYMISK